MCTPSSSSSSVGSHQSAVASTGDCGLTDDWRLMADDYVPSLLHRHRDRTELEAQRRVAGSGGRPANAQRRGAWGDGVEEDRGQQACSRYACRVGAARDRDVDAVAVDLLRERDVHAARTQETAFLHGADAQEAAV